ncbi:MAG TPA: DUF1761 domain-containing protein [Patescibacteria group bacterium]
MESVIDQIEVNYWAVLASGVGAMVVGAIWYNVFSKPWLKGVGLTEMKAKNGSNLVYLWSFFCMLVIAYVLAHVVGLAEADDVTEGLATGAWMWLGFAATTTAINYLYQQKSLKLYAIDAGYMLLVFLLSGAILANWPV